jgi:hypothetical protein
MEAGELDRFYLQLIADFSGRIPVRLMRAALSFAYITCLLLCFTHQVLSQIGQTKEELIRRYGPCQPNPAGKPKEPNAYDSVVDVGEDCTFRSDHLIITSMFKDGKAVAFDYRVELAFSDSLVWGERYQKLSELEILRLLWIAVPNARWVNIPSDSTIQRSRTRDSTAFAYYFASGHYKRHQLLVHTAAVDAIFKKTDKIIRGLRRN